jgi:uncharacterized membrane protein
MKMNKVLVCLAVGLVVLAVVSSIVLLASDSNIGGRLGRWTAVVSAVPLLAVGSSFLIFQLIARPRRVKLLKNVLLAATFLLWGAVQLMSQHPLAKKLGDLVIALYVAELAWTILAGVKPVRKPVD